MLGEPGAGKTPVGEILDFATSLYLVLKDRVPKKPGYKVTSNTDFLRGEPADKYTPIILDDPGSDEIIPAAMKSLLAVSEKKSVTFQRWSGACYGQGQLRIVTENKYDAEALPDDHNGNISNDMFLALIRPAFHIQASNADIWALCKRAAFVINTKHGVVFRSPGLKTKIEWVPRAASEKHDFIEDQIKPVLSSFHGADAQTMPAPKEWLSDLQWSQALMTQMLNGGSSPPGTDLVRSAEPVGGKFIYMENKPVLVDADGSLKDTTCNCSLVADVLAADGLRQIAEGASKEPVSAAVAISKNPDFAVHDTFKFAG